MIFGGYSSIFQMDRLKLLGLIQEKITLRGAILAPPFELQLAKVKTALGEAVSPADLIINAVDLELEVGTNHTHLLLGIEGGVLRQGNTLLAKMTGGQIDLVLDLVDHTFLELRPQNATLRNPQFGPTPSTPALLAQVNALINSLFDGDRGASKKLFPDDDNLLTQQQAFALHLNIDPQTMCTRYGAGDDGRLARIITGSHTAALGVDQGLLMQMVILPAVKQQLADKDHPDPDLPPPNGSGMIHKSQDGADVYITSLNITFADGYLQISGTYDASGTCWKVSGDGYAQKLYLDFAPGYPDASLVPRLVPPAPDLIPNPPNVHIDFWCEAAQVAAGAIVGILAGGFWGLVFIWSVDLLKGLLSKPSVPGQQPGGVYTPFPEIEGLSWESFTITPEGSITQGDIAVVLPAPVWGPPAVYFSKTEDAELTGGMHLQVTAAPGFCAPQTFDADEYQQKDNWTIKALPKMLVEPIDYAWSLNGVPVPTGAGTMTFVQTVKGAIPPPWGGDIPDHEVQIGYQNGGISPSIGIRYPADVLALYPRPEDFNYDVYVEVRATDALGQSAGNSLTVEIIGEGLLLGTDYYDYLDACLKKVRSMIKKISDRMAVSAPPRLGDPQQRLADDVSYALAAAQAGQVETHQLLSAMVRAYGAEAVSQQIAAAAAQKQTQTR